MPFTPLSKPRRTTGLRSPMITIGHTTHNRQTYLALNQAARKALGDPAAISLAWDGGALEMLIQPADPDHRDAYSIGSNFRCSVTAIMRKLDLTPAETHAMPARKHGTGLVIDVSGIRTASTRKLRVA